MRRVARGAALCLHRRVLVSVWSLLIRVTLNACGVRASRQSGLFGFEAAVWVVTVAAAHRAFQHFVMEGRRELRLDFIVTARAKLRVVCLQHPNRRKTRLLGVRGGHEHVGTCHVAAFLVRVRRVTIGATNVVAPVLSAPEVVPLFSARVTGQTSLGNFL